MVIIYDRQFSSSSLFSWQGAAARIAAIGGVVEWSKYATSIIICYPWWMKSWGPPIIKHTWESWTGKAHFHTQFEVNMYCYSATPKCPIFFTAMKPSVCKEKAKKFQTHKYSYKVIEISCVNECLELHCNQRSRTVIILQFTINLVCKQCIYSPENCQLFLK